MHVLLNEVVQIGRETFEVGMILYFEMFLPLISGQIISVHPFSTAFLLPDQTLKRSTENGVQQL